MELVFQVLIVVFFLLAVCAVCLCWCCGLGLLCVCMLACSPWAPGLGTGAGFAGGTFEGGGCASFGALLDWMSFAGAAGFFGGPFAGAAGFDDALEALVCNDRVWPLPDCVPSSSFADDTGPLAFFVALPGSSEATAVGGWGGGDIGAGAGAQLAACPIGGGGAATPA